MSFWHIILPNCLPQATRLGFPGDSVGKESVCSAGDTGSIPGLGRLPQRGHGNPF